MSKGIKVNNGHVNEVATQIETAKSYFRHVPLVPQDSKTTISANSKSKEAYGYAQYGNAGGKSYFRYYHRPGGAEGTGKGCG